MLCKTQFSSLSYSSEWTKQTLYRPIHNFYQQVPCTYLILSLEVLSKEKRLQSNRPRLRFPSRTLNFPPMHASFGTTLCGRLKFVASWIMANSNDPCSTTMVPIGRGEINPGVGKLLCMCFLNAQAFTLGFQARNTNASNISHLVKSYMLSSLPIIWMCTRLSYFVDVVRFEVNRTTFARSS